MPESDWRTKYHFLLLPGLDGTGRLFAPILEYFGPRASTYVAQYAPGASRLADLVESVRDYDAPWVSTVVIAESMGGLVAIDLCSRVQPRAAIFCAGFARPPRTTLIDLSLALPDALLRWLVTHPLGVRMAAVGFDLKGQQMSEVRTVLNELRTDVLRRRLAIIRRADLRSHLSTLPASVLYLEAESDRLVPRSVRDEFCAGVASITRVKVPGPHLLLRACPKACVRELDTFLRDLVQRAG